MRSGKPLSRKAHHGLSVGIEQTRSTTETPEIELL